MLGLSLFAVIAAGKPVELLEALAEGNLEVRGIVARLRIKREDFFGSRRSAGPFIPIFLKTQKHTRECMCHARTCVIKLKA